MSLPPLSGAAVMERAMSDPTADLWPDEWRSALFEAFWPAQL
jgi:hypothetical protein